MSTRWSGSSSLPWAGSCWGPKPADGANVKQVIAENLSWGVAALALGGVRSSESDSRGAASPLALGEHAIAGHLDPSIDPAAADLARRHGLAGFRFSGDSWWTEDYLGAKEDPGVGQEQLEQVVEAESWPWLSLVVAVPASGAASEVGAIATGGLSLEPWSCWTKRREPGGVNQCHG